MFGSDDTQTQGDTGAGMMPQSQPTDSGFGMPSLSGAASSTVGAPPMSDASSVTPPADEVAASPVPAMTRDSQDQTPDDLLAIKQDALQSLKPLVGHLDQTPEERFRMTMMMIQATDDQSLVKAHG